MQGRGKIIYGMIYTQNWKIDFSHAQKCNVNLSGKTYWGISELSSQNVMNLFPLLPLSSL